MIKPLYPPKLSQGFMPIQDTEEYESLNESKLLIFNFIII